MSTHEPWIDQLSEYLDDELTRAERAAVESHLAVCTECAATLAALRRVVAGAALVSSRAPERELWPGIAARMTPPPRRVSFSVLQLAAAVVLLATLSGGAVAFFLSFRAGDSGTSVAAPARRPGNEQAADLDTRPVGLEIPPLDPGDPGDASLAPAVSFADAPYDAAVVDLERALESGRGRLDEATVSVVEQNLSIIDRAIAEARGALLADPSNGYLSGHLMEARRRKLDLLRRAAALTQTN